MPHPKITLDQARRFAPIVTFHAFETFYPCSIDWLLQRSVLKSHTDRSVWKASPTQADLQAAGKEDFYLEIDPSLYAGLPLQNGKVVAPMYVTAQEWEDCIEITYAMLYAYQGGQTVRALPAGNHFNAILNDYGRHQGDFEWVSVVVSKDFARVLGVGYEAHGEINYSSADRVDMEGTHPRVRVALNGHACRNGHGLNDNDWIYTYELPGIVGTVDIVTKQGAEWRPADIDGGILLWGLDASGRPVTDQVWAAYAGRLGNHMTNDLTGGTEVDGSPLSGGKWAWIKTIDGLAKIIGLVPGEAADGNGPLGPAGRDFMQGFSRPERLLWRFDNGYTGYTLNDVPGIVEFGGRLHIFFKDAGGNGLMHIVSDNGRDWRTADPFHPDFTISDGPCPIVYGGKLHLFFRDGAGNGLLEVASSDGNHFAPVEEPNWYRGINIDWRPSAAVREEDGKVCVVAHRHSDPDIMFATRDASGNWQSGSTGFKSSSTPAIVSFRGIFHVFFKDEGNHDGLMHIRSADGLRWEMADPYHPDFRTSSGPSAVVVDNEIHLFFRDGDGNGILHILSNDGSRFRPAPWGWYIGLNCDGPPSATRTKNGVAIAARDQGGNGIMRALSIMP